MIAKMAGGAQMFVNQNAHNMLNIGQQNIQAVHELLAEWKIPLVAEDVGNNYGRTIEFDPATGELMIRTIGVGDTVIQHILMKDKGQKNEISFYSGMCYADSRFGMLYYEYCTKMGCYI